MDLIALSNEYDANQRAEAEAKARQAEDADKAAARQALIQRYGPEAGDVSAWQGAVNAWTAQTQQSSNSMFDALGSIFGLPMQSPVQALQAQQAQQAPQAQAPQQGMAQALQAQQAPQAPQQGMAQAQQAPQAQAPQQGMTQAPQAQAPQQGMTQAPQAQAPQQNIEQSAPVADQNWPATQSPVYVASDQPVAGMTAPGNIDLNRRQVLKNSDGTYSTERSISIGTDRGEVLIPTVVDGKQLTTEQAIQHYQSTGENLGTFESAEAADAYAEALHQRQGAQYSPLDTSPVGPAVKSGAKVATVISRAANHVVAAQRRGDDPATAFEEITPLLPMLGVTPEQAAAIHGVLQTNPNAARRVFSFLSQQYAATKKQAGNEVKPVGSPQQVTIPGPGGTRVPALAMAMSDGTVKILHTTEGSDIQPYSAEHDAQSTYRTQLVQGGSNLRAFAPKSTPDSYVVPGSDGSYSTRAAPYQQAPAGSLTKTQIQQIGGAADKVATGREMLSSVDRAADDAFNILKKNPHLTTTGIVGAVAERVPGTPAYDLARARDTILSNATLQSMMSLKNASQTGATGFGNMTEKELAVVQNEYAALRRGMGANQTITAINRIRSTLRDAQRRHEAVFRNSYGMTADDYYSGRTAPRGTMKTGQTVDIGDGITMQRVN